MNSGRNFSETVKWIAAFGAPLLLGRLSNYSHQLADSIMLGHFRSGGAELAAIAVAGLFFWILSTFLWPLSIGVQAIISRKKGAGGVAGSPQKLGSILDHGILTSAILAAAAFGLSFTAPLVFNLLLDDSQIIELAVRYIDILRWSLLPLGLQGVLTTFFSSIHKPRYSMITSIFTNAANIVFNYIFIYGKFGLPEMGISGAALGSLLSSCLSFGIILLIAMKREYREKYRYFTFKAISPAVIRNIVKISAPPAAQNLLAMIIMLLYESMVENIGAVYLAATHIFLSYYKINRTLVGGFAQGCAIITGNNLGAGNLEQAKVTVRAGYLIGAAIGLLVSAAAFFFPAQLAGIFSAQGPALTAAAAALKFFAPFFFLEIIGFTLEMIYTGNGWGKFVLFSEFSTNFLFVLVFTFAAVKIFGPDITFAWWGLALYQISYSLLLHLGYRSERWCRVKVE